MNQNYQRIHTFHTITVGITFLYKHITYERNTNRVK